VPLLTTLTPRTIQKFNLRGPPSELRQEVFRYWFIYNYPSFLDGARIPHSIGYTKFFTPIKTLGEKALHHYRPTAFRLFNALEHDQVLLDEALYVYYKDSTLQIPEGAYPIFENHRFRVEFLTIFKEYS
jgi:hypothetical protein